MAFRDTVVHWATTGADANGRPAYAAPLQYVNGARWEDKITQVIDKDGNEVYSSSTVYLAIDLMVGDILFRGTLAEVAAGGFASNPRLNRAAREVISKERISNLRGSQQLCTAYLK
jgi:hypothetical protein